MRNRLRTHSARTFRWYFHKFHLTYTQSIQLASGLYNMQCVRANHCSITTNNFWHTISVVLHNKSICFPRNTSQETMASQSTNDGILTQRTQCRPVGAIAARQKHARWLAFPFHEVFTRMNELMSLVFGTFAMVLAKLRRRIFGGGKLSWHLTHAKYPIVGERIKQAFGRR